MSVIVEISDEFLTENGLVEFDYSDKEKCFGATQFFAEKRPC